MRVLGVFFCWTFFVCRKTQTKKLGSFGCMSLIVFFIDVYIYIYIFVYLYIYIYLFVLFMYMYIYNYWHYVYILPSLVK